jgi:hypothetical protein
MEQINLSLETTGLGFGILILAFIAIHVVLANKYRRREQALSDELMEERQQHIDTESNYKAASMRTEELKVALANKEDEMEILKSRIARFERERCDDTGRFTGKKKRK